MKIYVGNLPFSVDDDGLKKIFSNYEVEEATIISDKYSGRSKGFGFVVIADDSQAKEEISELNDKEVEGRKLKVNEAKPIEERTRRDFDRRDTRRDSNRGRDSHRDSRRRY